MAKRPTKPLDDMTEDELRVLTRKLINLCVERLPPGTMFTILFCPFGEGGRSQYGSNCRRVDMVKMLRETAFVLDAKLDDPR